MAKDLTSETLKDPFSRAMKRAFEPSDVWTPRHLWFIRIAALAAIFYALFGMGRGPEQLIVSIGGLFVLALCEQLRRVWARVERLEADALLRDLSSRHGVGASESTAGRSSA
jgi:hypothetical protein